MHHRGERGSQVSGIFILGARGLRVLANLELKSCRIDFHHLGLCFWLNLPAPPVRDHRGRPTGPTGLLSPTPPWTCSWATGSGSCCRLGGLAQGRSVTWATCRGSQISTWAWSCRHLIMGCTTAATGDTATLNGNWPHFLIVRSQEPAASRPCTICYQTVIPEAWVKYTDITQQGICDCDATRLTAGMKLSNVASGHTWAYRVHLVTELNMQISDWGHVAEAHKTRKAWKD